MKQQDGTLYVVVSDSGTGPTHAAETKRPKGIGVKLVDAFPRQIGAVIDRQKTDAGYQISLAIPMEPRDHSASPPA